MVFPPPGYGLSDVALVVRWVIQIRAAYNNSPALYQELARCAFALEDEVRSITYSFPYEELNQDQQLRLANHIKMSTKLLEKVWRIYEKYSTLQTNTSSTWDRLWFGREDVPGLRSEITSTSGFLHGFRLDLMDDRSRTILKGVQGLQQFLGVQVQDGSSGWLLEGLERNGISRKRMQEKRDQVLHLTDSALREQELDPLSVVGDPLPTGSSAPVEESTTTTTRSCTCMNMGRCDICKVRINNWSPQIIAPTWPTTATSSTSNRPPLASTNEMKQSMLNALTEKFRTIGISSVAHDGYAHPDIFPSTLRDESGRQRKDSNASNTKRESSRVFGSLTKALKSVGQSSQAHGGYSALETYNSISATNSRRSSVASTTSTVNTGISGQTRSLYGSRTPSRQSSMSSNIPSRAGTQIYSGSRFPSRQSSMSSNMSSRAGTEVHSRPGYVGIGQSSGDSAEQKDGKLSRSDSGYDSLRVVYRPS